MDEKQTRKNTSFAQFWKQNSSSLIIALIISMVICGIVGIRGLAFPLWVWILIGLVCWIGRMWLLYRSWKRDNKKSNGQAGN